MCIYVMCMVSHTTFHGRHMKKANNIMAYLNYNKGRVTILVTGGGGLKNIFGGRKKFDPPRIDQKKFAPPQGSIQKSLTPLNRRVTYIYKNLCVIYFE